MSTSNLEPFAGQLPQSFRAEDPGAAAKPLEERHVQSIQQMLGALGRGDFEGFLRELHPEVEIEIHAPRQFPWRRSARGPQDMRALVEHNFATVENQTSDVLNVVAQGNLVVLSGRERGRLRESGADYETHFVYQFTFRDGQLHHVREVVAETNS